MGVDPIREYPSEYPDIYLIEDVQAIDYTNIRILDS
jgi:hypothetical protein